MFNKICKTTGLTIALIAVSSTTSQASGAIAGATEPTQLIRWGSEVGSDLPQQLAQVAHAVSQLETMRTNLEHLSGGDWLLFVNQALKLKQLVEYQEAVAYTSATYSQQFATKYKGFQEFADMASSDTHNQDYAEQYKTLNKTTQDTVKSALDQLNFSAQEMEDDQAFTDKLKSMAGSAVGQKQAMEVASQIALHSTEQMKKMQKVQMAETQLQAAWIAKQNAKEEMIDARESILKHRQQVDTNNMQFKSF